MTYLPLGVWNIRWHFIMALKLYRPLAVGLHTFTFALVYSQTVFYFGKKYVDRCILTDKLENKLGVFLFKKVEEMLSEE